jgi:lipoate-protein ligase B
MRRQRAIYVRLGRMSYGAALGVQQRVRALRASGEVPDALLTVEHDPVFTRGRSARADSFRVALTDVESAGIAVCDSDRGGGVTYHGPGQMVAYAILDLRERGRDVRGHVRRLEEAAIRTLARHGVDAVRREGLPGVWTESGKIASIGVSVRGWVTMHGLALNVAVDERHFAMIDPCGLRVRAVSLRDVVGSAPALDDVERTFVAEYGQLLDVDWEACAVEQLGRRDE